MKISVILDPGTSPAEASGDCVRARTVLKEAMALEQGLEVIYLFSVEVEGGSKPALIAEQVVRIYP